MNAHDKRLRLKELLLSEGCTAVPGVYDALSARIVEKTGFEAAYLGSYSTAISMLGIPDVGAVTMSEMVFHAKNVANCISIPLIVDAENGFFHGANIWRTVREMELAGAAAIHIEDHEFGKHTKLKPVILDSVKMCKKIQAACAARTDKDFLIIARTDVAWALQDVNEMVKRSNEYFAAGADIVFLAFSSHYLTRELRDQIKGPVVIPGNEFSTLQQETEKGMNIALYWPMLIGSAFVANKEACELFQESKDF